MKVGEKCIKCGSTDIVEEKNYITCKNCNLFRRKDNKKNEKDKANRT